MSLTFESLVGLAGDRLRAAIAVAGILGADGLAWEQSAADLDRDLSVNLHGVANLARAAVPMLLAAARPAQCRFVAVVSSAATRGLPRLASYVAAKHAALGYVQSLAADLATYGVTANAVLPGSTNTPLLARTARGLRPRVAGSIQCEPADRPTHRASGNRSSRGLAVLAGGLGRHGVGAQRRRRFHRMTAGPLRLADATWPDLEARPRGVLIVPLGATEQHGPHLPLDTDTYLASEIASRVNAIRPTSGLAPPIAFGSSGEHADFPGTLSIGTDVLRDVVVELVRDSSRHWSSMLVVNGHGGNLDALQQAADLCRHEGRNFAAVHLAVEGMDAHAGAAETSMMLYLDPDRVRLQLMRARRHQFNSRTYAATAQGRCSRREC